MIHAFDDPVVIAGQGTLGLELMESFGRIDKIYIPVGGGGLASGVGLIVKSRRPNVKIIGVESKQFPAMRERERDIEMHKNPVTIKGGFTIADGISVKSPGQTTFRFARSIWTM